MTLEEVERAVEHCRTEGADLSQAWFMRFAESYRQLVEMADEALRKRVEELEEESRG